MGEERPAVLGHRYEGRRADLRMQATTGWATEFPSTRLLRKLAVGTFVVGGGLALAMNPVAADEIDGTPGDDVIDGTNDDDVINGFDGDDDIAGDDGNDTINGGDGHDYLEGEEGDDTIDGGDGDDYIVGGSGDDTISGGPGDDFVYADEGDDEVDLGDGDDDALAGEGDDTVSGGSGNDHIHGDDGAELDDCVEISCDDHLDGGDGGDLVSGDYGDDVVLGGNGSDAVNGDFGDHWLLFNFELDELEDEEAALAIFAILEGETSGFDQLTDDQIDALLALYEALGWYGPGGNDYVEGGAGADIVVGGNGHDEVCGDAEDIAVQGHGGSDVPCVVFDDTLDASDGPVSGSLADGMRDLDDEDLELDEDGAHNPYEFVVDLPLISSSGDIDVYDTALGILEVNRVTGAMTFTADEGATGSENISYTVRRRVIDCADYSDADVPRLPGEVPVPPAQEGCDDGRLVANAIQEIDGIEWNYATWRIFTMLVNAEMDLPPMIRTPETLPTQETLPVTGAGDGALALAALALIGLGAGATATSRRMHRQHA